MVLVVFSCGVIFTAYSAMYVKLLAFKTSRTWPIATAATYNETMVDGTIYLEKTEERQWNMGIAGSIISAISIAVFGKIYTTIGLKLTDWENHKTQTTYDDYLILKTFAFQFLNNYFALFFIAFMKYGFIFGIRSTCKYDDCMAELELQLLILACKDLFMNVVQTGMPFAKQRAKVKKLQRRFKDEAEATGLDIVAIVHTKKPEHEYTLEDYDSTFNDFCEIAMQFGFCTLFAAAFPIGPLLAIINNIVEIRFDAFSLCRAYRRPEYGRAEDIGSWALVFETMSLLCCASNVAMICFVSSSFLTASFGIEHYTGWQWLSDPVSYSGSVSFFMPLANGTRTHLTGADLLQVARTLPNVSSAAAVENISIANETLQVTAELTLMESDQILAWESMITQPGRYQNIRLWISLLVIEHMVLLLRTIWKVIYSVEPTWVQIRRQQIEYHQHTTLDTPETRQQRNRRSQQFEDRRKRLAAQKIQSTWRRKVTQMKYNKLLITTNDAKKRADTSKSKGSKKPSKQNKRSKDNKRR
eukprot:SAG31_NODE_796_length_12032_cov_21.073242_16_plen_528_part_00